MGVNLVTQVRNFLIQTESFSEESHEVHDGCVSPGSHRVLRFDFLTVNVGSDDFVIGRPADRLDLFTWSEAHGHYHIRDFNEFLLFDASGNLATTGYKQAFCAIDIEKADPSAGPAKFYSCNDDQGISAGWADVYERSLACQFVVIDDLPDGDYTLQSTTNAPRLADEDCFGDNTIWTGLRINGSSVTEIDPPYIPEDRLHFSYDNVEAKQFSGRWKVVDGDHWMIDTGTSRGDAERIVEIIKHYKLSHICFVGRPRCPGTEPMMYFLTDDHEAPSGSIADEDIIPFNRNALEVKEIGGRWKVVEGTHWLLDFGVGEGNARAALYFIHKHKFDEMCFVGRPHPPMTYFKKKSTVLPPLVIDPRVIDWMIDAPTWNQSQAEELDERIRRIDFNIPTLAEGGKARFRGDVPIRVQQTKEKSPKLEIVRVHGISGLDCGKLTEIKVPPNSKTVAMLLAHFGAPPTITALSAEGRTAGEVKASHKQRSLERISFEGEEIDTILISSPQRSNAILVEVVIETTKPPAD